MIAPVLILLVVETLQGGFYFYTSASLNHATQYAARQILVGAVGTGVTEALKVEKGGGPERLK